MKRDDIDALTRFIGQLPEDSYLRDWLKSVAGEVTRAILNDFGPMACDISIERSRARAREAGEEILREATARADLIIEHVHREADRIQNAARRALQRDRDRIEQLRDALSETLRDLPPG